ncbi:MAG: hypothetical protein KGI19_10670 [Thaumarchaeota archaeon]|nr:hypothetical protein [Nitrososphaerota archaeon]
MSLEASAHKFYKFSHYGYSAMIGTLTHLQTIMESNSQRQIRNNSQILLLESKQIPQQSMDVESVIQELLSNWYDAYEEPVRIEKVGDEEKLFYNGKKMEVGKLYKITWNDQKMALRKSSEGTIDVYDFVPDKK